MSEVTNDVKTFQRNAKGVRELLSMKFETLAFEGTWYDAFGTPERRRCVDGMGQYGQRKDILCDATLQGVVPFRTRSLR